MSSTVWNVVPKAMAEVTEATTGSSVPRRVAFIGPISLIPVTKAVKDRAVPMMTIKATASQPVRSNAGQTVQTCRVRLRKTPPMIMPRPLATAAPQ